MPHDPKAQSGRMQDPDRLKDLLLTTKMMAGEYNCAALECTNNGVRELFQKLHSEDVHNHEVIFRFLHVRGHYPVKVALDEQVEAARQQYRGQYQNLMAGTPRANLKPGQATGAVQPPGSPLPQGSVQPPGSVPH
jgi:spore coat protein CotF